MCLNDDQLYAKIRTLFLTNHLSQDAPAFGVAMQVVRCGLGSLSWRQRFIYLGQVVPLPRTMDALSSQPSFEGLENGGGFEPPCPTMHSRRLFARPPVHARRILGSQAR